MFLGSYQLGDLVPLSVWTTNGADTPAEPDDVPTVHVYDADGLAIDARTIPIVDRRRVTGFFQYRLNLDADYETGWYDVIANYQIGGVNFAKTQRFEILPGGNAEGNGIAMHFFKPSVADYVLLQTDRGTLKRLRNPSVRGV